ncbi:TPA: class C sortase [Streptococcus equi subsp. zooepidemicus]|nr:class C sortase [Streptococcus equi]HEL1016145.1 class C sortase [Streptococcus equi subsp. ruminatorum]MCD3382438.1 class C sortase [Streptococcus equi subsp. zooepidemicus]MCD3389575.1 class C sortase [Streptococcus equi subsp. zooepidemicus]MCD3395584.1 class C sortase [Streptococcus equi subsp. zooepidemicus]MCD3396097.1 class C sortase [Streptococcus equi subsp. zooepidemicus]
MNRQRYFGYLLMMLGLGLPLIFLTMMLISQLQETSSYHQFQVTQRTWSDLQVKWIKHHNQHQELTDQATTDPFVESRSQQEQSPFDDDIIGYVIISKLNMVQPIRIGASEGHLEKGVAQVTGTSLPVGGLGTRSVIAGHRSWYSDPRFLRIAELEEGDEILIDLGVRQLEYRVQSVEIINAMDWQQLKAKEGQDLLTLLTCNPLYPPFNERLLVNAERVSSSHEETTGFSAVLQAGQKRRKDRPHRSILDMVLDSTKRLIANVPLLYWVIAGWSMEVYFGLCLLRKRRSINSTLSSH